MDWLTIMANSYRNFHTKGFDYLCLQRSEYLTVKAYFFDGSLTSLPELIVPHDHRYPFTTQVLAGRVANKRFARVGATNLHACVYQEFDYLTPLLGGNGFTWKQETNLSVVDEIEYVPGERGFYHSSASDIHTLNILEEGSVIVLYQFMDVVPVGVPTSAFTEGKDPTTPNSSGLYDPMTLDHATIRLRQLAQLGFDISARR